MTCWQPTDDGHADLASHDSFTGGAPHNTFARLRREQPLAWCDGGQYQGFWSVTRYDDIQQLNKNWQLLTSARGIRLEDQTEEEYLARRTFQETDPPEHTHTRMLVGKAFSKPVIAEFDATIKIWADRAEAEPRDFVALNNLGGDYIRRARLTGDVSDFARARTAFEQSG